MKSKTIKIGLYEVEVFYRPDGMCDIEGNINVCNGRWSELQRIPPIHTINGYFACKNNLISLKGCPKVVTGYFGCIENNLSTLEGGPEEVYGDYYCGGNDLISIEGHPRLVKRDFYCTYNSKLFFTKKQIQEYKATWCKGTFYYNESQILPEDEYERQVQIAKRTLPI